jgi:AcrR family transcriptional regulator
MEKCRSIHEHVLKRAKTSQRGKPYHHGDLAAALIVAAEALLVERGVEGFTLRECARRAGVSHAAPAHHFADAAALLTAVAASGFERLTAAITGAKSGIPDARERLIAGHLAYFRFAVSHPALFRLMFHSKHVNHASERIGAAGGAAFDTLKEAVADLRGGAIAPTRAPESWKDPGLMEQWSLIHGLATLAVEGRFGPDPKSKRVSVAVRAAVELGIVALEKREP